MTQPNPNNNNPGAAAATAAAAAPPPGEAEAEGAAEAETETGTGTGIGTGTDSLSFAQPAPTEFVTTRIRPKPGSSVSSSIWPTSLDPGPRLNLRQNDDDEVVIVERKPPCIRSRRIYRRTTETRFETNFNIAGLDVALGAGGGARREVELTVADFVYPVAYLEAIGGGDGNGNGGDNDVDDGNGNRNANTNANDVETQRAKQHARKRRGWTQWSIATSLVPVPASNNAMTMAMGGVPEIEPQPTYVVLGIFRRGQRNPEERLVFVDKPERLFRKLHWAASRLRGWRNTFFSLTHIKELRVYRCDVPNGIHERVRLDRSGVKDMQQLLYTYKRWHVPHRTAMEWSGWIHRNLNGRSHKVPDGKYAIELVLGWSMTRISVVVLLPVLLSLAIGIYLNAQDWSDLATIQTAWGTASYIVTTGGRKF